MYMKYATPPILPIFDFACPDDFGGPVFCWHETRQSCSVDRTAISFNTVKMGLCRNHGHRQGDII
jgi:hypothetical protein